MDSAYFSVAGSESSRTVVGPLGLFGAASRMGLGVLVVYPGKVKTTTITTPPKTVVVLDDGDVTLKLLQISRGGPAAFDSQAVRRLVHEASHVIVNADDLSSKVIQAATLAADFCGPCLLIETCDYFSDWAKYVLDQRPLGAGVLLSGPLGDLSPEIQSRIKGAVSI